MNPVCASEISLPSMVARKVFCSSYSRCLEMAIASNWPGFSCERCRDYRSVQQSQEEWATDGAQCAALLVAAMHPNILRQVSVRALIEGFESSVRSRQDILNEAF